MKMGTTCLLVTLLCVLVASCAKTPGPVTGEWSAPANGLQAALRLSSADVANGTEVPIIVVFRNHSDTPLRLPVDPYYTVNVSHNGEPVADAIGTRRSPKTNPICNRATSGSFALPDSEQTSMVRESTDWQAGLGKWTWPESKW